MIIAVTIVGMVQVTIDKIVDVIPMGHRLVTTSWTVNMIFFVSGATMVRGTGIRVFFGHIQPVLVYVVIVHMVEMPIVEIVDMVSMSNGCVPTIWAMHM